MKKYLTIIEVLILISCISLFFYEKYTSDKTIDILNERIVQYSKISKTQTGITDFVLKKDILEHQLEGKTINGLVTLTNLDRDTVTFSNLCSSSKNTLYFLFTGASCSTCVKMAIKDMVQLCKKLNKHKHPKIYILSPFENQKFQKILTKQINCKNITTLSFKKEVSPIPMKFTTYPLFFLVSPNGQISNVYIHDQIFDKTTKEYLGIIADRFWN